MGLTRRVKNLARSWGLPARVRPSRAPMVSVVVPFYNVEAYLDRCLRSILSQTLPDLEVILVDDGSTDGSAAIAAEFAARDARIRILAQTNSGPGAARNNALSQAHGTYLAFVDSDDCLPREALALLVQSAETNGADIVMGAVRRFNTTRAWIPEWVKGVHALPRDGIRLSGFPPLLRNNYPWNKVFRREFWQAQGLAFREGVIYEDQPLIALMLLRANRINVLTNITYEYRAREDRSSISQRPEERGDLADRVDAWQLSLDALAVEASNDVLAGWYTTVYGTHLHWYLDNDAIDDPDYWRALRAGLTALRSREPKSVLRGLSPEKRVALLLLDAGLQREMIAFRNAGGYDLGRFPSSIVPAGLRHDLPLTADTLRTLPEDVLVASASTLGLKQQLLRGGWSGEYPRTCLSIAGYALIRTLDLRDQPHSVEIFATNRATGEVVNAETSRSDDPALHWHGGTDVADYSGSAYDAEIDVAALRGDSDAAAEWDLYVRVNAGPFAITEPLRNLSSKGGLTELSCRPVGAGLQARLVGHGNRHLPVTILLERPAVAVQEVTLEGRLLTVTFRALDKRRYVSLHVRAEGLNAATVAKASPLTEDEYRAVLTVPPLPAEFGRPDSVISWSLRAEDASGARVALTWGDGRRHEPPLGTGSLRAYGSAVGNIKLEEYPQGCVFVTGISSPTPDYLRITAEIVGAAPGRLVAFEGVEFVSAEIENSGHRITAMLKAGGLHLPGADSPGRLTAAFELSSGEPIGLPVVLGEAALRALPLADPGNSLIAERTKGRGLVLRASQPSD